MRLIIRSILESEARLSLFYTGFVKMNIEKGVYYDKNLDFS